MGQGGRVIMDVWETPLGSRLVRHGSTIVRQEA